MWAAILGFLSSLPKLLGWAQSIIDAVSNWLRNRWAKEKLEKLEKAADEAKQTKDTSKLEDIFRNPNK